MGHYDVNRTKTCNEDEHDWGDPYVEGYSTSVVLEDGSPHLKVRWTIEKRCQNERESYSRGIGEHTIQCQKTRRVDRDTDLVEISDTEYE